MLTKQILYCGQTLVAACDGRCDKAWGINTRPRVSLSDDPDDYVWVADSALGTAPEDPGTYEGMDGKPTEPGDRLNRWCVRECERSRMKRPGELIELPDMEQPRPNMKWRSET